MHDVGAERLPRFGTSRARPVLYRTTHWLLHLIVLHLLMVSTVFKYPGDALHLQFAAARSRVEIIHHRSQRTWASRAAGRAAPSHLLHLHGASPLLSSLHHRERKHQRGRYQICQAGEDLCVQVAECPAVSAQLEGDDFRNYTNCVSEYCVVHRY